LRALSGRSGNSGERRLEIVHVLPHAYPLGGTERSVLDLLESPILADLEQRVVFLRGGPLGPFPAERVLARTQRPRPNLLRAAKALIQSRPRIVHGWLLRGNVFAAAIGLILPDTVVLTNERNLGHNLTAAKHILERLVGAREDTCVVNSEAVREAASKRVRKRRPRIRVISPGIEEPVSAGPSPRFSCVAVGRLESVKEHETLLRAWPLVLREQPAATLAIIGDGPRRGALESFVDANGLRGSVSIVGAAEPAGFLRAAEVFASTSRSEGFSRAMLEALAMGKPVVATAVGGALELPREAVRLVPVGDSEATAREIVQLLGSDEARVAAGGAARAAYTGRYTLEHCHSLYRGLYEAWLR
jgi:glycosyltransferase involved in cell wall biosynthesis